MKLVIPKGATSRIVTVFIQANNVTTGAGLGSLTNASSIVGGYVREGGTGVALAVDEDVTTEGTYQAPSAAGKVRIGTPANMRSGTYELHFHNDLWATGAETVSITLGGATNMADLTIEVQLSDPVRGLGAPTALPNAAANAAGGLLISAAGGFNVDTQLGTDIDAILADTNELQTDWVNGGRLDLLIDSIISKVDTVDDFLDTEVAAILAAVDTEVAAILALLDDARTEPGQGAPPVNPDLATKIDYLYKAWRNKKDNDGTTTNLYADNGTTIDHKQATSESAGTVTKAEWITGA